MINYTKDFTKYVASKEQALRIVSKVADLDGDKLQSWTVIRVGRYIKGAEGQLKNFRWKYSAIDREISVHFTDGRPEPETKDTNKYFIIWIEGFNHKTGDKVKGFNKDGSIIYTHKMSDSLRIEKSDIPAMRAKLKSIGIADWVTESDKTFVKTSYAPKGTLFKFT